MRNRLQISTRKLSLSEVAIECIKIKAKKLEKFYNKIIACKVMVEAPHRHKNHGVQYNVSIDIVVPGGDVSVKHEHNEDVYVAIRDAFDSARRQLQNLNQRQKGKKPKSFYETNEKNVDVEYDNELYSNESFWASKLIA